MKHRIVGVIIVSINRAFVLLSGGIDSTVCLYKAVRFLERSPMAISFRYGQRHDKEIEHAIFTCEKLGVRQTIINAPFWGENSLTNSTPIPTADIAKTSIYGVPFRNGFFLSMAAAHVHEWCMKHNSKAEIHIGVVNEPGHADTTPEFIDAMADAIRIGTRECVTLNSPLQSYTKSEVIDVGNFHGIDWTNTWSCFLGQEIHCGVCPACRTRRDAFKIAGANDPTTYASN